ncbi:MAG: hypothetical protein Q4D61_08635, partial [Cardiobacteriaceae bacterium]|nr:hypothetical protein [Cardiobacteriaceae bacterium]
NTFLSLVNFPHEMSTAPRNPTRELSTAPKNPCPFCMDTRNYAQHQLHKTTKNSYFLPFKSAYFAKISHHKRLPMVKNHYIPSKHKNTCYNPISAKNSP